MMTSQIADPQTYSRRLVASLGIALAFHALLFLIPIYRWLGSDPGESSGVGGGKLPFSGTLLGAPVVIRSPENLETTEPTVEAQSFVDELAPPELDPSATAETADHFNESDLAVELMPPDRSSAAGAAGDEGVRKGVLAGSLQPLGGGGGIEIEMELVPKRWKAHNPLPEIVVERKIRNEEVRLQVLVDTDGHVIDYRVLRSIPRCPECTATVVESAMLAVFDPPVFEGERVRAWVLIRRGFGTEQQ